MADWSDVLEAWLVARYGSRSAWVDTLDLPF